MTRQQLLWLFIWIFIFFLISCLWNKLQHFKPEVTTTTQSAKIENVHLKEMHFKALKEDDSVTLSGNLASEDAKNTIIDAYGKVFTTVNYEALQVDEMVKEDALLDFFTNFADNFSNFKSGYLSYNNGSLEIDGLAEHPIVEQTLQEQLASLTHIKVDNHLHIEPKVLVKKKLQEPIATEQLIMMTAFDMQEALDKLLKNRRVQFLYARDILTSDSKALVDEITVLLKKNPAIKIEIAGHTDSDGTKKNNLRLSKMRANGVKKYMISKGISKERLHAAGYGESKPLVSNKTLKNRRINRRVEFKVIGE